MGPFVSAVVATACLITGAIAIVAFHRIFPRLYGGFSRTITTLFFLVITTGLFGFALQLVFEQLVGDFVHWSTHYVVGAIPGIVVFLASRKDEPQAD